MGSLNKGAQYASPQASDFIKWKNAREVLSTQLVDLELTEPQNNHIPCQSGKLQNFLNNLIEYTLAGHMQHYQKLTSQEFGIHQDYAEKLIASIPDILQFNQAYTQKLENTSNSDEIFVKKEDLTAVSQAIGNIIKLEDTLLNAWANPKKSLTNKKKKSYSSNR